MKRGALIIVSVLSIIAASQAASTPRGSNASEDKDARSYLMVPADGAAVSNLVKFVFSLGGMGVAPAWTKADNTGYHHLLIDTALKEMAAQIPSNEKDWQYGRGQTETQINLSLGKHTPQLILGDLPYKPHNLPVVSKTITIYVK